VGAEAVAIYGNERLLVIVKRIALSYDAGDGGWLCGALVRNGELSI